MKKSALTLFLIAIALASVAAINHSHASEIAIVSVDSATQQFPSAHVGDTIHININVSNVQNLWSWDIADLRFNPNFLNLTQVSEGPFLKKVGSTLFLWTSQSTIAISKGDIPDVSCTLLEYSSGNGSGVIATLTFQVISIGTSQITFNQTTLLTPNQIAAPGQTTGVYEQINSQAINANITVGTSTGSSLISSSPEISSSASACPSWLILVVLLVAATVSMLLFSKKARSEVAPSLILFLPYYCYRNNFIFSTANQVIPQTLNLNIL
jgi:hypothetical protein